MIFSKQALVNAAVGIVVGVLMTMSVVVVSDDVYDRVVTDKFTLVSALVLTVAFFGSVPVTDQQIRVVAKVFLVSVAAFGSLLIKGNGDVVAGARGIRDVVVVPIVRFVFNDDRDDKWGFFVFVVVLVVLVFLPPIVIFSERLDVVAAAFVFSLGTTIVVASVGNGDAVAGSRKVVVDFFVPATIRLFRFVVDVVGRLIVEAERLFDHEFFTSLIYDPDRPLRRVPTMLFLVATGSASLTAAFLLADVVPTTSNGLLFVGAINYVAGVIGSLSVDADDVFRWWYEKIRARDEIEKEMRRRRRVKRIYVEEPIDEEAEEERRRRETYSCKIPLETSRSTRNDDDAVLGTIDATSEEEEEDEDTVMVT